MGSISKWVLLSGPLDGRLGYSRLGYSTSVLKESDHRGSRFEETDSAVQPSRWALLKWPLHSMLDHRDVHLYPHELNTFHAYSY